MFVINWVDFKQFYLYFFNSPVSKEQVVKLLWNYCFLNRFFKAFLLNWFKNLGDNLDCFKKGRGPDRIDPPPRCAPEKSLRSKKSSVAKKQPPEVLEAEDCIFWHRGFPVNLQKFCKKTSGWLLLVAGGDFFPHNILTWKTYL